MTTVGLRYCVTAGCPNRVTRGRCPGCARAHSQRIGSSSERGYDWRWRQYSRRRLQRLPLCGMREDGTMDTVNSRCAAGGLLLKADGTDHVVPVSRGGDWWDPQNHMSACTACNSSKGDRLPPATRSLQPSNSTTRGASTFFVSSCAEGAGGE